MDKKWVIGIVSSIIIIPCLTLGWKNMQAVWAAPDSIKAVDTKVDKTKAEVDKANDTNNQLTRLILEQQARMDKSEAVYQANLQSTREQLQLIAEIKRGKK